MNVRNTVTALGVLWLIAGAAVAEPGTMEEVQSVLSGFRFDTYSADVEMTTYAGGMTIAMTGDMQGRGEEMVSTMTMNLMGQTMITKTVIDDSGMMWIEIDTDGAKQVMKGEREAVQALSMESAGLNAMPQNSTMPGTSTALLDQFGEIYALDYVGVESIDGDDAYAFEGPARPKYKEMFRNSPQLAQLGITLASARIYLGKDDGFMRKVEVLKEDGTVFTTQSYTNVVLNEPLSDNTFRYTPPDGVAVIDLVEQAQAQAESVETPTD